MWSGDYPCACRPECRAAAVAAKDPPKTLEELEKELAQKKEKPKDPFEAKRLVTQPAGGTSAGEEIGQGEIDFRGIQPPRNSNDRESAGRLCKVGHWTGVSWENVKANDYDFVGEMEIAANDVKGQPLPLPATPYNLTIGQTGGPAQGSGQDIRFGVVCSAQHAQGIYFLPAQCLPGRRHGSGTGIARSAKHAFLSISLHRAGPGAGTIWFFE